MEKILITIIIPVLNEELIIENTLKQFFNDSNSEVIVVDGGSKDNTIEIVNRIINENQQIKLVYSQQLGRANQMNYGATIAQGNTLLFLHSDTTLPTNYLPIIQDTLNQKEVVIGAFQLKIAGREKSLRIIEKMVNLRSHFLALPYGDQGFFLTKKNFQRLSGFADLPIMEDFDLIQRGKRQGKIAIANEFAITSARRWQKLGAINTTIVNQLIIIGYYLKISPDKLRKFYRYFN